MIKAEIIGGKGPKVANVDEVCGYGILATADPCKMYGTFASGTHAAAGTTAIVTPLGGGSVIITDILVTSEKKQNGTITVRFTDGTNTVNMLGFNVNDAPAQLSVNLAGRFPGWKDARVEMVTVEDFDATVTIGYLKVVAKYSLSYNDWDALR